MSQRLDIRGIAYRGYDFRPRVTLDTIGLAPQIERSIRAGLNPDQIRTFARQTINREGERARGVVSRDIRQALPIALKYIRRRVVWRPLKESGEDGYLRLYGAGRKKGKTSSAWIRPRHMRPQYPRTSKSAIRSPGVTYGVGGLVARTTRKGSWAMSVSAGPAFHAPWSGTFDKKRMQVWERVGRARLPIQKSAGTTIGQVARITGAADRIRVSLRQRISDQLGKRLVREARAAARAR